MKKRIFYPIWKMEEVEAELAQMERQGWRLSKLFGMYGFEFTKSKPKEAQYLLTYSFTKGLPSLWLRMLDIEYEVKSQAGANPVAEDMSFARSVNAFRITQSVDLQTVKIQRDQCLRGIVCYNMLLLLFLAALWASVFVISCIRDMPWFGTLFAGTFLLVFIVGATYYFIAWWQIKRRLRRAKL